jgi:hypothetical protein
VLFDGNKMNAWERVDDAAAPQWGIEEGVVAANETGTLRSKQVFASFSVAYGMALTRCH